MEPIDSMASIIEKGYHCNYVLQANNLNQQRFSTIMDHGSISSNNNDIKNQSFNGRQIMNPLSSHHETNNSHSNLIFKPGMEFLCPSKFGEFDSNNQTDNIIEGNHINGNLKRSFKHLTATGPEVNRIYLGGRALNRPFLNLTSNTFNKGLYRSNSSLHLDHVEIENTMKREFGSSFSINTLNSGNGNERFYNLLKEYRKENINDCKPNLFSSNHYRNRISEKYIVLRNNVPFGFQYSNNLDPTKQNFVNCINDKISINTGNNTNNIINKSVTKSKMFDEFNFKNENISSSLITCDSGTTEENVNQSPKIRNKFPKFWESNKSEKVKKYKASEDKQSSSVFRRLRSSSAKYESSNLDNNTSSSVCRLNDPEIRLEEKLRKKAFAHYDCQSITANLNFTSGLNNFLNKRRNTTTGASAASMVDKNICPGQETDNGDGRSNNLLFSCPYFRNELGGEKERMICLNRQTNETPATYSSTQLKCLDFHRPNMSTGLALLENANEIRWKTKSCPYQKLTNEKSFIIENCDIGASYYRTYFFGFDHQNWFGIDENLGPLAISLRKERVICPQNLNENDLNQNFKENTNGGNQIKHQYRVIIRTSQLSVMRGTVFEKCIPVLASSRHNHHNNHHAKEVLEYITPELNLSCLRLGASNADEQLLKLDEQVITKTYKVGVILCKNGQGIEEEMYNNEHSSPAFEEFLSCLGEKVRLKGFNKYRAGLDNKTDTTGLYSVYTSFNDFEIMFHVSTLLPYSPNNKQQLLRKRHIGNDIVTIVFQEPEALPFTPKTIRSHFQHVFIVVRLVPSNDGLTKYAIAVSRSKEVPVFGPPIPESGIFVKSKAFTDFLLAKIINGENAAHKSEKFSSMAKRTRAGYLKDLTSNFITNTSINDVSCGNSASAKIVSTIFGTSKKKGANKIGRDWHFIGNSIIKGAIVWEMSVEDYGQSKLIDALIGISSDTFLIIEETTKEIIFSCPNFSILGWTSHPSCIKIFYHQGECILLKCKDPDLDEIAEIVIRLKAVTQGCETQELILKRNSVGQLGFHVGYDGIVTEVENYSFAWQAGLKQNSRIVEICKVAIATLNHEQMIDLLKTSITVSVTILIPNLDGSPKRACTFPQCLYLSIMSNSFGNNNNIDNSNNNNNNNNNNNTSNTSNSNSNSNSNFINNQFNVPQNDSPKPSKTDYENIGITLDTKNFDNKTGIVKSNHINLPNMIGLHYSNNSVPLTTSQSSKNLLVSPDQEIFDLIGNPSSCSSIYHKSSTLVYSSPSSIISSIHTLPKNEMLRPKSTTSENVLIESHSTKGSNTSNLKNSCDRLISPNFGNVMLSRSELSLTNKSSYSLINVANPKTSNPITSFVPNHSNRSQPHHFSYLDATNCFAPIVSNSSILNRNHNQNEAKSSFALPPFSSSSLDWSNNTWSSLNKKTNDDFKTNLSLNKNLSSISSISMKDLYRNRNVSMFKSAPTYANQSKSNSFSDKIKTGNNSYKISGSSCSLSSTSNLQEDLLKLINLDYIDEKSTGDIESSNTSGNETSTSHYSTPYSSLERSSNKSGFRQKVLEKLSSNSFGQQLSQTVASQPSSPEHNVYKDNYVSHLSRSQTTPALSSIINPKLTSKIEKQKPEDDNITKKSNLLISDNSKLDWPTLVETATKAITKASENNENDDINAIDEWLKEFGANISSNGIGGVRKENVKELEETVKKLQYDLVREQSDKASLEEQVKSLKEENIRLLEESKTAAAQLRKFTEWFFQNINSR